MVKKKRERKIPVGDGISQVFTMKKQANNCERLNPVNGANQDGRQARRITQAKYMRTYDR